MPLKFKNQLRGERLVLKRTMPSLKTAQTMFKAVDENREHLSRWLSRVKFTLKVEDSLKYLFDKEEEFKK